MIDRMSTDEIVHWLGQLVEELARRASQQPAPAATPPWLSAPAPAPVHRPGPEPRARPFTAITPPVAMAPMPPGGLPPGTPLGVSVPRPGDPLAALRVAFADNPAVLAALEAAAPPQAPRPPSVVTTTAKTDPETARVFAGLSPRADGVAAPYVAGTANGAIVVEPG